MSHRASLFLLFIFCMGTGLAHPGGDPPANPPLPFVNSDCALPTAAEPVNLSYHVWMATKQNDPDTIPDNCNRIIAAQQKLIDNQLHIRLFPKVAQLDCSDLPVTQLLDSASIGNIEELTMNMHKSESSWDDLVAFISEAKGATDPYYTDQNINIYVVDKDLLGSEDDFRGMHVRDIKNETGNLIFLPALASDDTFLHELAHAFSLSHVNFWTFFDKRKGAKSDDGEQKEYCVEYDGWDSVCDFVEENIMWAAKASRNKFTRGQKARMVCNDWSALNRHGDHAGDDLFKCPDWTMVDLNTATESQKILCPVLHDGIYEPAP